MIKFVIDIVFLYILRFPPPIWYSMQHHMIKFVIDIVFLYILRFPPPIWYSIQHHMIKVVIDIVFLHILRFPPPIGYYIQYHMIKLVIDIVFLHLSRFPPPIGYSIQHHVIKFDCDFVVLRLLRFPPPIGYYVQHHVIKPIPSTNGILCTTSRDKVCNWHCGTPNRFPPPIRYYIQHHVIIFFLFLVSYWFPDTTVLSFTNETNTQYQFHYCFWDYIQLIIAKLTSNNKSVNIWLTIFTISSWITVPTWLSCK